MNNNSWDKNGDGRFDIADVFRIVLPIICYGLGMALMFATLARSYHLLSSPQFNPGNDNPYLRWWPLLTATSAEFGLLMSWVALEVGIRKGHLSKTDWSMMLLTGVGGLGFVIFASRYFANACSKLPAFSKTSASFIKASYLACVCVSFCVFAIKSSITFIPKSLAILDIRDVVT